MEKKHYFIIFLVCLGVLIINNLSLLYGTLISRYDFIFLGRHNINFQDLYTYISFTEQAKQGRILFENLYMSEAQHPSLVRPSYILIGFFAGMTHLPSIVAYHLARIGLALIFFAVLYKFLGLFWVKGKDRILAFIIVLTASGVGFFVSQISPNSSDLWIPESITFLALNEAPHFVLSLILMLGGFMLYLKGLRTGKMINYLYASGVFLLLSFEHPFNIVVVGLTIAIASVWYFYKREFEKKEILISIAISFPFLILGLGYQIFETMQNPILQRWAQQNLLLSPHPINYLFGYGLILLFAIIGAEKFLREQKTQHILVLSWIAATVVLLYSPVFFQRRFIEGLHIPLAILVTYGLITFALFIKRFVKDSIQAPFYQTVIWGTVAILSFSSFAIVIGDLITISRDQPASYYYHLLRREMDALVWTKKHTTFQDVILANYFYGNLIPGIIGRKVYVGHKVQTPYFDTKVEKINKFLLNKNSKEAYRFLKDNGITYIFLGKNDSMLVYGFKPDTKPYLIKVYDVGGVGVYKVKKL